MRTRRNPALLPLILLSLLNGSPAVAAGWYQVEMIVFRQAGETTPAGQTAPDDWAKGAQPIDPTQERATALDSQAEKLNPANGYQVLLHQAWTQELGSEASSVALHSGNPRFDHYPVEGTLSLVQARYIDLTADLWINKFDESGLLLSSERLKQGSRLQIGKLTYLDHGNLGILIRINSL
jgi:hypothetical protein